MTYDEFWYGDPCLVIYYREAYRIKTKVEQQNNNFQNWLLGTYMTYAIAQALSGSKSDIYPEKPLPITKEEQEAREEEKRQRSLAYLRQQLINESRILEGGET